MQKPHQRQARTPARHGRHTTAQPAATPDGREDDDPVPADLDEFRAALARRIMTFLRMPQRCREPICRRSNRCAGRNMRCTRDQSVRQFTREKEANMRAHLKRALQRRLAAERTPDQDMRRLSVRRGSQQRP